MKMLNTTYASLFLLMISPISYGFDLTNPMQRNQARAADALSKFDINKDNQITLAEVKKVRNAEFTTFDKAGKNKVTLAEYENFALQQANVKKLLQFKVDDKNKDGRLSYAEFRESKAKLPESAVQREFIHRDKNGNEALNTEEYLIIIPSPFGGGNTVTHTFKRADINRDGILLREEYAQYFNLMGRLDKNRDRILTKAELEGKAEPIRFGSFGHLPKTKDAQ